MSDTPAEGARFGADWLALREPFDAAAREATAARLLPLLRARRPAQGPWRVMDLGCGTGANLRWLAPRLGGAQQWLVLDHDAELLQAWGRQPGFAPEPGGALRWGAVQVQRQRIDLATDLQALPWHAAQLVTASALLDLAGAEWLQALVALAAPGGAALLFALSVDGRHRWTPADRGDAQVARLFAAHQRRDKGLGPALGAQAVAVLAQLLRARGYRVWLARSDWVVEAGAPGDALAMQRALIEGMGCAAIEQGPQQAVVLRAWQARRTAMAAEARLRVGHLELLALPAR